MGYLIGLQLNIGSKILDAAFDLIETNETATILHFVHKMQFVARNSSAVSAIYCIELSTPSSKVHLWNRLNFQFFILLWIFQKV